MNMWARSVESVCACDMYVPEESGLGSCLPLWFSVGRPRLRRWGSTGSWVSYYSAKVYSQYLSSSSRCHKLNKLSTAPKFLRRTFSTRQITVGQIDKR